MKFDHAPILLVDHDSNDVLLIQRALWRGQIDIGVVVAQDADFARAYLSESVAPADGGDRARRPVPALVLLDIRLAGGKGIELLAWMRARPELRRVPVIVLSASREPADVDRAYDAGCNSYLLKPVAFEALQTMLTTFGRYWLNFNVPPRAFVASAAPETVGPAEPPSSSTPAPQVESWTR